MKQRAFKEKINLFFHKLFGRLDKPDSKKDIVTDNQTARLSPDLSAINPQRLTTKKDIYKCFTFMLYRPDTVRISQRILDHDRLHLVMQSECLDYENEILVKNAKNADILFLSSGARETDIDRFLEKVGIQDKMVIVVSVFDPWTYKEWIKARVDCHFDKVNIHKSELFKTAIKPVLDDLDGIAPLPELKDDYAVEVGYTRRT